MPTAKRRLIAASTSMPPPIAILDDDRNEGQHHRADQPEPARRDGADPLPVVLLEDAQNAAGRRPEIEIDPEPARRDAGRRNEQRGGPAGEGDDGQLQDDRCGRTPLRRRQRAENEAGDDGGEGRALDQGVAGDQFFLAEMVGEDAVFYRSEQRRDAAEPEQGDVEERKRGEIEARRGDRLNEDLGELQAACDRGLVVGVGDLAAERRQRDLGQGEDRDRQRDLRPDVLGREAEEDHHRQHLADEVVVERGKELTPKERCEAPRTHQCRKHGRRALTN